MGKKYITKEVTRKGWIGNFRLIHEGTRLAMDIHYATDGKVRHVSHTLTLEVPLFYFKEIAEGLRSVLNEMRTRYWSFKNAMTDD